VQKKNFIPVNIPIITNEDALEVYKTVKSGWVSSSGLKINEFENKLAKFTNRKFCCCVSSGTAALEIAVRSLDIGKNDEVITPAFTIISNANAIIKNFAKVVLVDSDPITWNINIDEIKKKITSRTKAIMIPHIYGFPADMEKIINICKKKKIYLIEDAAEMIGQKYKNIPCGSFGDISTFSFYANKHITTGEGGAIFTNNRKLDKKIRELRNLSFGKKNRFNHTDLSWNYRFTNIQAALGLSQLKRIKSIIKRKKEIGNIYYNNFKNNKNILIQPNKLKYASNIYWVFGIILRNKFHNKKLEIQKKLLKKSIETRPFFWPMHKQNIFKKMGLFKNESYPIAENLSKNGFYLPSGVGLKNDQIDYIVKIVNKILSQ
jgi:perosamine synthetase